jgi:hypothetical protein
MAEKPTAAFVLSLLGSIFIIIGGLIYAVIFSIIGGLFDFIGFGGLGGAIMIMGVLGIVWGILALVGAIMMNSEDKNKVRTGAILVLIFSILSWLGAAGGLFIGFLLGLIGSILGLTWNPSRFEAPPPPP